MAQEVNKLAGQQSPEAIGYRRVHERAVGRVSKRCKFPQRKASLPSSTLFHLQTLRTCRCRQDVGLKRQRVRKQICYSYLQRWIRVHSTARSSSCQPDDQGHASGAVPGGTDWTMHFSGDKVCYSLVTMLSVHLPATFLADKYYPLSIYTLPTAMSCVPGDIDWQ